MRPKKTRELIDEIEEERKKEKEKHWGWARTKEHVDAYAKVGLARLLQTVQKAGELAQELDHVASLVHVEVGLLQVVEQLVEELLIVLDNVSY